MRTIVKDYIDFDKKNLKEYILTITEKKLAGKVCDLIVDTYVSIRYFNLFEHVKKKPLDNIEYHVKKKFNSTFNEKDIEKNKIYLYDAILIIKYLLLAEKKDSNLDAKKILSKFESKLKERYADSKVLILELTKRIKDDCNKKRKFINGFVSNDFSVCKISTDKANVYEMVLENSVKIPDIFSQVAINRVYNSGAIGEDKMLVYYLMATSEILKEMIKFCYKNKYLVDFEPSLLTKKNKLTNVLKIIDLDYLKERIILKVCYNDYLEYKDNIDDLIRSGISFAVCLDEDYKENILLDIFSYIIATKTMKKCKYLDKYENVLYIL